MKTQLSLCFRPLRAALLLGLLVAGSVAAAGARPAFVEGPVFSSNSGWVQSVHTALKADYLVIQGGLMDGLQVGAVCRVLRGNRLVGEIILIEVNRRHSAALILSLAEGHSIEAGDVVRVKTF